VYEIVPILESLATQAHPEGGWPYAPGQTAHLEPTCLALLALALERERFQGVLTQGLEFVERCAAGDGSYRLAAGRPEAIWPTALVLLVKAVLGSPAEELDRSAARLLALQGRPPDNSAAGEMHDIDLQLVGWPWAEGNFSWAEPTAWACLALRRAGHGGQERVAEGLRLLLDRASDEGGINYGNRKIFGRATEPIPGPTALMLIALQGKGHHPRVRAALAYLRRLASLSDDIEHLCWAKLALDLYPGRAGLADLPHALDERLVAARQQRAGEAWLRPAPLREALSALALGSEVNNPFRIPAGAPPRHQMAVFVPSSQRRSLRERFGSLVRGWAVKAVGKFRQVPVPSTVHIAPVTDYNSDLAGLLQRQYEAFRERVPLKGKRVVLKPNLVEYHRDKVINTHPPPVCPAH
jgi:hypothetical protein